MSAITPITHYNTMLGPDQALRRQREGVTPEYTSRVHTLDYTTIDRLFVLVIYFVGDLLWVARNMFSFPNDLRSKTLRILAKVGPKFAPLEPLLRNYVGFSGNVDAITSINAPDAAIKMSGEYNRRFAELAPDESREHDLAIDFGPDMTRAKIDYMLNAINRVIEVDVPLSMTELSNLITNMREAQPPDLAVLNEAIAAFSGIDMIIHHAREIMDSITGYQAKTAFVQHSLPDDETHRLWQQDQQRRREGEDANLRVREQVLRRRREAEEHQAFMNRRAQERVFVPREEQDAFDQQTADMESTLLRQQWKREDLAYPSYTIYGWRTADLARQAAQRVAAQKAVQARQAKAKAVQGGAAGQFHDPTAWLQRRQIIPRRAPKATATAAYDAVGRVNEVQDMMEQEVNRMYRQPPVSASAAGQFHDPTAWLQRRVIIPRKSPVAAAAAGKYRNWYP